MACLFNGESKFLFNAEFTNTFKLIKDGPLAPIHLFVWILLLMSHLIVISLFFLTKKSYFNDLLIVAPLSFVILYIAHASALVIILLIPFIIVWIIALIKQRMYKPN